ncbi:hypothetical protein REDROCK_39 [Mycobacterium phage RedRock]|uniref:Uncharacterized protein n=1 Tax=Mycobacterium phage RedRock TaxID=711470 RepID=D3JZA1_9CAUD|nr:hypothetical protein REDROCK_39 [Mycobacterium phage RedRock]ADB93732.1 hypothetical protein REDROCK_39 [Mycobacterium phage RedRock]
MTLTDLICKFISLRAEHGDLEVKLYVPDRDYGDSSEPIADVWTPREFGDQFITLVS